MPPGTPTPPGSGRPVPSHTHLWYLLDGTGLRAPYGELVAEPLSRSIAARQARAYQRSPALRARLSSGQQRREIDVAGIVLRPTRTPSADSARRGRSATG